MSRLARCLVALPLLLLCACGAEGDGSTRASNPNNPAMQQGIGPSAETGPAARDMQGGGRGSMGPHEKGK